MSLYLPASNCSIGLSFVERKSRGAYRCGYSSSSVSSCVVEVFKITHDLYDPDVSLNLAYYSGTVTRGNKYKLINNRFHYDLRKYYFSARIVNIWNSLPNHVVDVNSVNLVKARLDRFWMDQDVKYDFTADLTGTGDRSVNIISET